MLAIREALVAKLVEAQERVAELEKINAELLEACKSVMLAWKDYPATDKKDMDNIIKNRALRWTKEAIAKAERK